MEYNIICKKLLFFEYGCNVQEMIVYVMEIENWEECNKVVWVIIEVMGQLNLYFCDVDDFCYKFWIYFFVMFDFCLEVDFFYEILKQEVLNSKLDKMEYLKSCICYGYYGKYIQVIFNDLKEVKDIDEWEYLKMMMVNFMKK